MSTTLKENLKIAIILGASFVLLFLFAMNNALALPEIDRIVSGNAEIVNVNPATMQINATDRAIINYKSFNIGQNESVIINLPQVSSEILNRVIGGDASQILGNLSSNGIVVLVNEKGIFFGPNSNVNVAGLIASTRDITDSDFLSANYVFNRLSKEQLDTLLLNQGTIQVREGGFGVFIAGAVENQGTIICPMGTIAMAGGDMVRLDIAGNGLISIAIDQATAATVYDMNGKPITDQIKNSGTLRADGGVVLLHAESLPGIFEKAINLEGIVRADTLEGQEGEIRLVSSGKVVVNADVSATKVNIGNDNIIAEEVTGSLIATDTIKVMAERLEVNALAPLTEIYKPGDINLTNSSIKDGLITLSGEGVAVTYLKTNNITLRASGVLNTSPGIIIQGNQVNLQAQKFGTLETPITVDANNIIIKRITGNIDIMESLGIGTSILLRGPPDGFGAITYPISTNLTLQAEDGSLTIAAGVSIYANNLTLDAKNDVSNYGAITATDTIYLYSDNYVNNYGYLEYQTLIEKSYDFGSSGTLKGGTAYIDDVGGATLWLNGNLSGTYNDADYIYINGDVTLIGNTTLNSGTDGSGSISFSGGQWSINSQAGTNYSLTLSIGNGGTGALYAVGNTQPIGNLTLNRYASGTTNASYNFYGDITMTGNFTVQDIYYLSIYYKTSTVTIGGNMTITNKPTIWEDTSTFIFNSETQRTVNVSGNDFYNVIIGTDTSSGNVNFSSSFCIRNNLSFNTTGGTTTLAVSSSVYYRGATLDLTNLDNFTQSESHSFTFEGTTITVTSAGKAFNNVTIGMNQTTTLVLADTMDINGLLTIASNGTTALNLNGQTLKYAGYTLDLTNLDVFTTTNSTFEYDRVTDTGVGITTAGKTFYNFVYSGSPGFSCYDSFGVTGALTTSGSFNAAGQVVTVTGLTTISGGTYSSSTASQNFNGGLTIDGGTLTGSSGNLYITNLTINSGALNQGSGLISITGTTTLTGGIFQAGTGSITFGNGSGTDSVTMSGSAELRFKHTNTTSGIVLNMGTGTWTNNGGTITYNSASAISSSLRSALSPYYNLTINSTSSTYTLDNSITINGNLTLTAGTLAASTYTINIAGNWSNSGTFTYGNSTVIFNGSSTQFINANQHNFFNLTISNTSTYGVQCLSNGQQSLIIQNNLIISSNAILDIGYSQCDVYNGNFYNDGTFRLTGSQGENVVMPGEMDTDSGTVEYTGNFVDVANQLAAGDTYYNLTFSGVGSDYGPLDYATVVNGNLTFASRWTARRLITIDAAGETLTDFPVMIKITADYLKSVDNGGSIVNANGYDILFTGSDGRTYIGQQIESYDGATGTVIAWVKATLSTSTTPIYMYYGNGTMTSPIAGVGAWNANYKAVWHMDSTSWVDSITSANNGTSAGNVTTTASGIIGTAGSFDGDGDYISKTVANWQSTDTLGTISAWVNFDTSAMVNKYIFSSADTAGAYYFLGFGVNFTDPNHYVFVVQRSGSGVTTTSILGNTVLAPGTNYYLTLTSNGTAYALYVNGQPETLTVASGSNHGNWLSDTAYRDNFAIGTLLRTSADFYFKNIIDEVRYSNSLRSANWIAAEYANQSAPADFYTIGDAIAPLVSKFDPHILSVTIGGNFSNAGGAGIYDAEGSTYFNKASGTQTLDSGGATIPGTVRHTGAGTLQLINSPLIITSQLLNQTGNFDANGLAVTAPGQVQVQAGTYYARSGTQTFNGGFSVSSGATFNGGSATIDTTNVLINSTGSLIATSGNFYVSGNWTDYSSTGFNPGNYTVTFDAAAGTQIVDCDGVAFYNVNHTGAGALVPAGSYSMAATGTFNNSAGSFNASTYYITFSGPVFISGGSYSANTGVQTFNGGLTIDGGTFTGSTGWVVVTDLTINSGVFTAPSGTFYVSGNWDYNGGTFTPGTGANTVTFNKASGTQTIDCNGASFNKINHTGAGILQVVNSALTVTSTLTNSSGAGNFDANGQAVTVTGLTTITGSTYLAGTAKQTFNGGLTLGASGAGSYLTCSSGEVEIAGTLTLQTGAVLTGSTGILDVVNVTFSAAGNPYAQLIAPSGDFTVSGTWDANGYTTFTPGTYTVIFDAASGTQTIDCAGAAFNNINHTGAGLLQVVTSALLVGGTLVNSSGAGNFDANAQQVNVTGLTTVSGGTYLAKGGYQTFNGGLTIDGGTFTGVSSGYTDVNGNVTINSGALTASTNFYVSGNWDYNGGTFTPGTYTVLFDKTSGTQTIDCGAGSFKNINHNQAGLLQVVNSPLVVTGTLTNSVGNFDANGQAVTVTGLTTITGTTYLAGAAKQTFNGGLTLANATSTNFTCSSGEVEIAGTLTLGTGSTFTGSTGVLDVVNVTFNAAGNPYAQLIAPSGDFTVSGNWNMNLYGTFTAGTNTVTFDGAGAQTINGSNTWYNLYINNTYSSPSATYDVDPSAAQTVTNTLTVNDGRWTPCTGDIYNHVTINTDGIFYPESTTSLYVSGNLTNNGNMTFSGSHTMTFNGGDANINAGSGSFYNVTINSTGTKTLTGGKLDVNQTLTLTAGTLAAGDYDIDIYKNLSGTGTLTNGNNTATFNGNGAQTINGARTWYNLYINNIYATPSTTYDVDPNAAQTVTGTLTINDGQWAACTGDSYHDVVINANGIYYPDTSASVSVTGNWTINGNGSVASGIVHTITFNGTEAQAINPGSSTYAKYYNVTIANTTQPVTLQTNSLTLYNASSTFTLNANAILISYTPVTYTGIRNIYGTVRFTVANPGSWGDATCYSGSLVEYLYTGTDYTNTYFLSWNYYNVTVNVPNAQYIRNGGTGAISVAGTLTMTAGNLDIGGLYTPSSVTINGTLAINGGTLQTGTGSWIFGAGSIVNMTGGTFQVETANITNNATWNLTGGTVVYSAATLPTSLANNISTYYSLSINSGTFTNTRDLVVNGNLSIASSSPFSQGAYDLTVGGNFSLASNSSWTKATGGHTVTFNGDGYINDNHSTSADIGIVIITNNSTRTQTRAAKVTTLTVNAGSIYDLNGYAFTQTSSGAITNYGTVRLQGGETVTGVTGVSTDSGTVEYNGRGAYTGLKLGNTYYNLKFSGTGQYTLNNNLTVNNNITFPGQWTGMTKLSVNNPTNYGTLDGIPLLVEITAAYLKTIPNGGSVTSANGYDIIFTDANGSQLWHDVDSYNPTTGTLRAWVKSSYVGYGDWDIYMYYGNSLVTTVQESASNTWSAYTYVYHFEEGSWNGTSGEIIEAKNESGYTSYAGGDATTTSSGMVGRAATFDGNGDYAALGVTFPNWSSAYVSFWLKNDAAYPSYEEPLEYSNFRMVVDPQGYATVVYYNTDNVSKNSSSVNWSTWHHFAVALNTYGDPLIYIDNIQNSVSGGTAYGIGGASTFVGAYQGGSNSWNGQIDEVRCMSSTASGAWVHAEYNTVKYKDTFFTATGNLTPNLPATLVAGSYTINVSGSWQAGSNTSFSCGTSNVNFTGGTGTKTILSGGAPFYDLTFNDADSTWNVLGSLNVNRNLTVTSGTVNLAGYSHSVGNTTNIATGSSNATLNSSQRKSFFDTVNSKYWAFYYTGSAIEYAYSADGNAWTTSSTLAYNTPDFSVAYKAVSDTGYAVVVAESGNNISYRKGTIAATSISFTDAANVFSDASTTKVYSNPTVALDGSNYIWVAARDYQQSLGYQMNAIKSNQAVNSGTITWGTQYKCGSRSALITEAVLVPASGTDMHLLVGGESNNITHYTFSSSAWASTNTGGDYSWFTFAYEDLNGSVEALAIMNGELYVGGNFTSTGSTTVNYIAKWSSNTWSALGTGLNGPVRAFAVLDSSNLYVGGLFTKAGSTTVNRVAKYNTSTGWSALGSGTVGVNGDVYAMTLSGTNLYVGGAFTTAGGTTVNRVAKWNGSAWSALGTTGVNGNVYALTMISTDLYVGGKFTLAGSTSVNNIAKWNGSAWSALGTGITGGYATVFALTAISTDLYAGGSFSTAGGNAANRVAKWNGSAWSALGSGLDGLVYSLAAIDSTLYAGGNFTNYISSWNGSTWSTVGSGTNNGVRALAVTGSTLYVGGTFTTAGGTVTNYIAKYESSTWTTLSSGTIGVNNTVYALAMSGSDLYLGGTFTTAGGTSAGRIVKYTPSTGTWTALSTGMNNTVYALAVIGTDIYAGGAFTTAGGTDVNRVAKWNGTSWSALGTGVSNIVRSLAVSGSNLYVGGYFTSAGGDSNIRYIAKWNGSAWSAVGTSSTFNSYVNALYVNGSDLYAGGAFTTIGASTIYRIAKFNGTSWSALSTGANSVVNAITMINTDLYIGGYFTSVGSVDNTKYIAKWNGSVWASVGGAGYVLSSYVTSLAVMNSTDLYAAGAFTTIGETTVNRIAKWDGSTWEALNTGDDIGITNGLVYALTVNGTDLYVGGSFTKVKNEACGYVTGYGLTVSNDSSTCSAISAVSDNSGYLHILYVNATSRLVSRSYGASTWSTTATLTTSAIASPTLSINKSTGALTAFWTESNTIKSSGGAITSTAATWDNQQQTLYSSGTNTYINTMADLYDNKTPILYTQTSGETYTATASMFNQTQALINVGGNYFNSGTVYTGSSTIILNGAALQSVTTGAGSGFSTLKITNTSAAGVKFVDALRTAVLTTGVGVQKLAFGSTGTHMIYRSFNVGGSEGNLLTLTSGEATPAVWHLYAPSTTVSYVNVSYSDSYTAMTANNSTSSSGNNTNWTVNP